MWNLFWNFHKLIYFSYNRQISKCLNKIRWRQCCFLSSTYSLPNEKYLNGFLYQDQRYKVTILILQQQNYSYVINLIFITATDMKSNLIKLRLLVLLPDICFQELGCDSKVWHINRKRKLVLRLTKMIQMQNSFIKFSKLTLTILKNARKANTSFMILIYFPSDRTFNFC